jgi:hypothetical protein
METITTIPHTCPHCHATEDPITTAVDNVTLYDGQHYQHNGDPWTVETCADPKDADVRAFCQCCGEHLRLSADLAVTLAQKVPL